MTEQQGVPIFEKQYEGDGMRTPRGRVNRFVKMNS